MFGALRIHKAREACVQALQPFVTRPETIGPWPPSFWRDSIVIGFVVYVIATVRNIAARGKLTGEQRGHVFVGALKQVGGYSPEFMDQTEMLTNIRDPAFMLGGRNAETVLTYLLNLHPMPGDQDVVAATEVARATTLTGEVGREEIGGSLIYMLFTQVVKERLAV